MGNRKRRMATRLYSRCLTLTNAAHCFTSFLTAPKQFVAAHVNVGDEAIGKHDHHPGNHVPCMELANRMLSNLRD
eukprot:3822219-Amphidinium_carterae.1